MSAQIVEVVDAETLGCGFEEEIRQRLNLQMWEVCLLFKGAGESHSFSIAWVNHTPLRPRPRPPETKGESGRERAHVFRDALVLGCKRKKRTPLSQPGKPRPRGNSVRNSVL